MHDYCNEIIEFEITQINFRMEPNSKIKEEVACFVEHKSSLQYLVDFRKLLSLECKEDMWKKRIGYRNNLTRETNDFLHYTGRRVSALFSKRRYYLGRDPNLCLFFQIEKLGLFFVVVDMKRWPFASHKAAIPP